MSDAIPDEPQTPTTPVEISGFNRLLSTGAKVWMGQIPAQFGGGFAMHFTSKDGEITKLCLSAEALLAVFSLYESLSHPESLSYRLLVKFTDGLTHADVVGSEWTPISEDSKEPAGE